MGKPIAQRAGGSMVQVSLILNIFYRTKESLVRGKLDLLFWLLCAAGTGRLCVHQHSGISLQMNVKPFTSKTGLDSEPRFGGVQITDQTRNS